MSKPKRRTLLKVAILLPAALLLFAAGVAVGHGSWSINNLDPTSSNEALPTKLNYSQVSQLYELLKQDFDGQLKEDALLDGLKDGLVKAAGDPYTDYLNPDEAKDFKEALSGSFSGIGAELGATSNGNITIIAPLDGSPADKAGLKSEDIIAGIDGRSTQGLSVEEAVRKIRGEIGTTVKLTIIRNNQPPFELTLTRSQIIIPSIKSQVDGQIGYIKINQFSEDTAQQAYQIAETFKDKNVKAILLDLRGNPGGFLNGAVDVASLWLEKDKTIVSERRAGQTLKTFRAGGQSALKGLPTVVLIDRGSASASEIVAGALHDHKAAILVGQKSFGKGSIQQVEELAGGGELKVTIARWYTPAGKNIDKQGIKPDIEVKITEDDQKANRDPQKDQAYQLLQQKIQ